MIMNSVTFKCFRIKTYAPQPGGNFSFSKPSRQVSLIFDVLTYLILRNDTKNVNFQTFFGKIGAEKV